MVGVVADGDVVATGVEVAGDVSVVAGFAQPISVISIMEANNKASIFFIFPTSNLSILSLCGRYAV
jgi:hypothetical protein